MNALSAFPIQNLLNKSSSARVLLIPALTYILLFAVAGLCMIPLLVHGEGPGIFQIHRDPDFRSAILVFFIFAYVIPIILLLLMYIAILKVIWFDATAKHLRGEEQERRWKQRIQVFRSLCRVVICFILLYGYFFAVLIWIVTGGHTRVSPRLSYVLLYSAFLVFNLNTCINPLIYALHLDAFRPFVYKLVCPKRCHLRKPTEGALNTTQHHVPMASRTAHNGQEGVAQISKGQGATEAHLDEVIVENNALSNGNVNECYHDNEKTSDTEICS